MVLAAGKTLAALVLLLCLSATHGSEEEGLTPQSFLEDNQDIFQIIGLAVSRVPQFLDDVVSLEGGATFVAPLDSGFVAASNRTVEDMLEEIQDASDESLINWLGQWAIPTRIDTPDKLLDAERVETVSGMTLVFSLTASGTGVVAMAENDPAGAGGVLGPAAIDMGQVVTYVLMPLSDAD